MYYKLYKTITILSILSVLWGCVPAVGIQELQNGVSKKENISKTIADMEKETSLHTEMWYWLNMGRLYQVTKNYEKSIFAFNHAEAILDEYENRAAISLRNVGAGIGSTFFSKGAETYYGKGYERTLMHTLNGINYAMLGNFEGAAVEMRKMESRQEFWLMESQEKITEANKKKSEIKGNPDTQQIPQGYSMTQMLQDPEVRDMVNNYQDAFSYSLSSIINNISNDTQYAQISQKRAMLLSPEADAMFDITKNQDSVDVYVIALTGQAPAYSIDKIRFPLFSLRYYIMLDLPSLKRPREDVSFVNIYSSLEEKSAPRLLKSDKMAYKTLKDELPVEITKSILRATSKGVMAKQASDSGGALGGLMASVAMDITSTMMEKSYRNWELLPNSGFLSKISAKRGDTVVVKVGTKILPVKIPIETKKGSLILVSYLANNNVEVDHVEF